MSARPLSRLLAAGILGIAFGIFSVWHVSTLRAKGRQAYVVDQAEYFEKRVATEHSNLFGFAVAGAYIVAWVGIYELLAFAIHAAIKPRGEKDAV